MTLSRDDRAHLVRIAVGYWRETAANWVAATLDLASQLWDARQDFGNDNNQFGAWLDENNINLSKDDRAALLGIGKNMEFAKPILEQTDRRSIQLIWRNDIKPLLQGTYPSVRTGNERQEGSEGGLRSATTTPLTNENDLSSDDEEGERGESEGLSYRYDNAQQKAKAAEMTEKDSENQEIDLSPREEGSSSDEDTKTNKLLEFDQGAKVAAVFQSDRARLALQRLVRLGKKKFAPGGKQLWAVVVELIDAGVLVSARGDYANLRLLFPDAQFSYARKFDLGKHRDRHYVCEVIVPAAIGNKARYLADPTSLETLVREQEKKMASQQHMANADKTMLAPGEEKIVMFGECLWPRPPDQFYSYKAVRSAVWVFLDWKNWGDQTATIGTQALNLRHFISEMEEFVRHEMEARMPFMEMSGVVKWLTRLWEKNPEARCEPPSRMLTDRDW